MTKNSVAFPDNAQYGFSQLTKNTTPWSITNNNIRRQQQQQQQLLTTKGTIGIQNSKYVLTKLKQQFTSFTIIQPEDLPLISICKKKRRGESPHHNDIEVVYNSVQPSNVCQGCVAGHKFCYFETRGPKARLRRCTACIERHLSCIMRTDNNTSKKMVPDSAGDLIIPLAFKHYFLQYRCAQTILKHSSQFIPDNETCNDNKILKEAKEVVRRFRPVSLQVLRRYPFGISKTRRVLTHNNNTKE